MAYKKIRLAQSFMSHVWIAREYQDIEDYLVPHLIVESPLKTSIGSMELSNSFAAWFRAFPDLKYTETGIDVMGDWVSIDWAVSGNHLGEFLGIAATGHKIQYSGTTNLLLGEGNKINAYQAKVSLSSLINQISSLPLNLVSSSDKEDLFSHFNRIANLNLTHRQIECIALVCLGNNQKNLSDIMGIQYSTFRTHLDRVLPLLGLSSAKEIFSWAFSKHVLELLIHIAMNEVYLSNGKDVNHGGR